MARVLFFTCVNRKYESFVPLYACAALHHVADSAVEVGVENGVEFALAHLDALRVVRERFPGRLHIREANFPARSIPHVVRFVNEPQTKAAHTYIGDIDVLILERDIVEQHLGFMRRSGLPYSNKVRAHEQTRLTGLHFTETDKHYPLPDVSDLDLKLMSDEAVLYEIVKRKGLGESDPLHPRPVHGIHMSPSRPAVAAAGELDKGGRPMPDWGLAGWRAEYEEFASSAPFLALRPHLRGLAKEAIETIETAYSGPA